MGLLRHRRYRRQDSPTDQDPEQEEYDDDDQGDEGDDDDSPGATSNPSAMGLPTTTAENQFDKAKAIGEEVIKKVPSKFDRIKNRQ